MKDLDINIKEKWFSGRVSDEEALKTTHPGHLSKLHVPQSLRNSPQTVTSKGHAIEIVSKRNNDKMI